jgi:hypothetical protein
MTNSGRGSERMAGRGMRLLAGRRRDARAQSAMWLACAVCARRPPSHYPWTTYRMCAPMDLERRPMRWSLGGLCAQGLLRCTVRSTSTRTSTSISTSVHDRGQGCWAAGLLGRFANGARLYAGRGVVGQRLFEAMPVQTTGGSRALTRQVGWRTAPQRACWNSLDRARFAALAM